MSDEELIARLRDGCNLQQRDGERAAKRIEALTRERDEAYRLFAFWRAEADRLTEHNGRACVRAETAEDRIEALEAKLTKAVETLEESVREFDCPIARATIAEIKGESHD